MKRAMPPVIDERSKVLILGTMPGEKSLEKNEYYGNPGNHFWKLIFEIFNGEFTSDFTVRKKFILDRKIALWDVLETCHREGSLDSKIKNELPNDFSAFFRRHTSLKTVIFASKMAEKYFDKYAVRPASVKFITLPSPSGANAGKSYLQKLEEWQILRELVS